MHAGTSADDPEDAFAAVSLRFMTPHPVCEKAISAAFNSLFPMITRRIYHSEPRGGEGGEGWCLCVFGRQSVSVRGSPLSSPGDGRRVWKEIYFCAGGRRRRGIHFIYFIITDYQVLQQCMWLRRRIFSFLRYIYTTNTAGVQLTLGF